MTIFIYTRSGKIKALSHPEATRMHVDLTQDGWEHTKTLDACTYLEYLHNQCEDVACEIKSLAGKLK